jgi:prefoldin subunit 5
MILLPDFNSAEFEPNESIDNPKFPLIPGTILSYGATDEERESNLEDLEDLVEQFDEQLDSLEERVEVFEDSVEDDEVEDVIEEIEDEVEEVDDELDDVEDLIEEIEDELEDAEEIEDFLEVEALKQELNDEVEDLNDELDHLQEKVAEIEDSVESSQLESFIGEINESLDDLGEISGAIEDNIFTGNQESPIESNQIFVTFETKEVAGIETIVVRDVAWDEGTLVEDTFDWYAQDTEGNVWYLGEIATNYEYDEAGHLIETNNDGSWEAGIDGALPGFLMKAAPQVGDRYYQEFYPGFAEDEAEVINLDESVEIGISEFDNVLKTRDFTQLEPDVFEFKYYVPGIGQILAEEGITEANGEPELSPELLGISSLSPATLPALSTTTFEESAEIDNPYFPLNPGILSYYEGIENDSEVTEKQVVLVSDETIEILGITSRVVQEWEFEGSLLTEESFEYYAQDTSGNVWLMGESSIEYEYDDDGNLTGTEEEIWQGGVEQNLPGYVMVENPEVGEAYYERFQINQTADQSEVTETDILTSTPFADFEDVVQIQEFSGFNSDEFELSYFAPNIGFIKEEEIEAGDVVFSTQLIEIEDISPQLNNSTDSVTVTPVGDHLEVSLGDEILAVFSSSGI